VGLERLVKLKIFCYLIDNRSRDLPASIAVPQPTVAERKTSVSYFQILFTNFRTFPQLCTVTLGLGSRDYGCKDASR
jgi:hypothetical protein